MMDFVALARSLRHETLSTIVVECQLLLGMDKLAYNMRYIQWMLFAKTHIKQNVHLEIIVAGFAKTANTNVHCIAIFVQGRAHCFTISEPAALICFRKRDDNTVRLPLSCVFGIKPGTVVWEG
jgi:hypothetical protein